MKDFQLTQKTYVGGGITLVLLLVLLTVLTSGASLVQAANGGPKWSTNAMACTPNGSTIASNLVQTSHGNARFTDGKTGDLYLICSFSDTTLHDTYVTSIEMHYRSQGTGKVSAVLRKMDKQSGEVSNLLEVRTEPRCLTDSGHLEDEWSHCRGGASSPQVLDFNRYYYYVQFSLQRSNAADAVHIVGATIW